jgi:hypothetical protein
MSVRGAASSPALEEFRFGALGEPIFKFGIAGRRGVARFAGFVTAEFSCCRRTFACSVVVEFEGSTPVTTAGTAAIGAAGWT